MTACPDCTTALREVTARARSGYLIVLDQCPDCGGIWCDRWELFPLSHQEAARLDAVDEEKLSTGAPADDTAPGTCPRCAVALRPFRDPLLPPAARIERCRVCDGMWLKRGQLRRLKQRGASTPPPAERLDRLVRAYGAEAKWATVPDLDAALHDADVPPAAETLRGEVWAAAAWLVAHTLFRLLLRLG